MYGANAPFSRQDGKLGIILAIVIALIAIAAGIYYFGVQSGKGNRYYSAEGETELHGLVHWERSNIPATNIRLKLYQATENTENLLASTDVENAYYRISEFESSQPVFLRVFRLTAAGAEPIFFKSLTSMLARSISLSFDRSIYSPPS